MAALDAMGAGAQQLPAKDLCDLELHGPCASWSIL